MLASREPVLRTMTWSAMGDAERAALVGVSEGGPLNLLFAATHPDRTAAMVIIGTYARIAWAPD